MLADHSGLAAITKSSGTMLKERTISDFVFLYNSNHVQPWWDQRHGSFLHPICFYQANDNTVCNIL